MDLSNRTRNLLLIIATLGLTASCITIWVQPPAAECALLTEAVQAEALRLGQCSADSDCGQVLAGTSCGCTRDLVATVDADTSWFYELTELALEQDCPVFPDSVCDCPQADGYACDLGQCTWAYDDAPGLPNCSADEGAPSTLGTASITGDTLAATVSYGGGCADHDFTLCWPDQAFAESWPVQARLEILNQPLDDNCQALLTEGLSFDLTPLRAAWRAEYGLGPGQINVKLGELELAYGFGGAGELPTDLDPMGD